jgi:hypothetical protein
MDILRYFRLTAVTLMIGLISLATVACAGSRGETLRYTDRNDIMEGPGLFTGEEGAFTFSFGKDGADEAAGGTDSRGSEVSYRKFETFRQFREAETEATDTGAHSSAYEDFQLWKEWNEYQEWKRDRERQ